MIGILLTVENNQPDIDGCENGCLLGMHVVQCGSNSIHLYFPDSSKSFERYFSKILTEAGQIEIKKHETDQFTSLNILNSTKPTMDLH